MRQCAALASPIRCWLVALVLLAAGLQSGQSGKVRSDGSLAENSHPSSVVRAIADMIGDESAANDEEALPSEDAAAASHLVDRHLHSHLHPSAANLTAGSSLLRNCSYVYNEVFCDCDLVLRRFACYNIQSVDDIRRAFDHLLNATRSGERRGGEER